MPLKKCFSSPHLAHLVKVAQKESPRRNHNTAKHGRTENGNRKSNSLNVPIDQPRTLKKCFSSPHLNDLDPSKPKSAFKAPSESSAFKREVINCRFRSCGCSVSLSRERMDTHLRTNAATHSLLILNKIDALGRQNEQVMKRLSTLETSMVSMTNLFDNLQEVLSKKGISTHTPYSSPSLGILPMDMERAAGTLPLPTSMKIEGDTKTIKRNLSHLDAAAPPVPPAKRQRKVPAQPVRQTPQLQSYINPRVMAMAQRPQMQHYPGTNSMQGYSFGTMAATSSLAMPISNQLAHQQMMGLHSSTGQLRGNPNMQYAMVSSLAKPFETQIDSASLRAQTQQAAKRVQDLMGTKGKMPNRRKVRGRTKKGKNMFEAPKKPKTAYNYYQIGVRESILAEIMADNSNPSKEMQSQKVARIIGERWKSMPEHEREAFNTLAAQDKQRYKRELEDYVHLKAQLKEACKAVSTPMGAGNPVIQSMRPQQVIMAQPPRQNLGVGGVNQVYALNSSSEIMNGTHSM